MPRAIRKIAGFAVVAALAAAQPASGAYEIAGVFGSEGAGDGQFNLIEGIAVGPNNQVYVCDGNNARVQRFTLDGQYLGQWGSRGAGPGQFNNCGGVAADPTGNVFVVDTGGYRVEKFDANGNFIQVIGKLGSAPEDFHGNPNHVAVGRDGNIYVSDRGDDRVLAFTNNGAFIRAWGSTGTGDGQFRSPAGLAVGQSNEVWVADQSNSRVQSFLADGSFRSKFGSFGSAPGQFGAPEPVLVLPNGNILVGDFNQRNIQEFTPAGAFVSMLRVVAGTFGSFRPVGLAQAPDGRIYMTDQESNTGDRVIILRQVPDAPPAGEPPVLAESVAVEPVRGEVTFKTPGSTSFRRLEANQIIPVGSAIDVSKGTVGMTAASRTPGATQKGNFTGGRFRVAQAPSALTTLRLQGGTFASCRRNVGNAQTAQRRRIRRLSGNARGRFRTRGRHSSATVRGTRWVMEDRCDGTLTRVRTGVVVVRDFAKRRNIRLRRGGRYLARPRSR